MRLRWLGHSTVLFGADGVQVLTDPVLRSRVRPLRDIGRLERAAANAPRPYLFVVLPGHGQSQGTTFEDRYGYSLGELVRAAMHGGAVSEIGAARVAGQESWGYAGAAVADVTSEGGRVGRALRRSLRDRRDAGRRPAVPAEGAASGPVPPRRRRDATPAAGASEAVVLAPGNLGLVYLNEHAERMSLERIGKWYPDLVPALAGHPGIRFILVRSDELGPVVIGRDGVQALQTQTVRGADPLQAFGASARWQVLQTDSFPHCADNMVNSMWDPQTEEVAAFEHLVGSHGGLGGEQAHPFVLYPSGLPPPAGPIRGADERHQVLRKWLAHLGHEAFC